MKDLIEKLKNPELHFPGNFDTPARANAVLMSLCQEAADALAAQQEPVAWMTEDGERVVSELFKSPYRIGGDPWGTVAKYTVPLYTRPQAREPLTDEQIKQCTGASDDYWASSKLFILAVARAIEAKLREKNCA